MDEQALPDALRELLAAVLAGPNAFYEPRLQAAGIDDAAALTLAGFTERCPFTTKAELSADQSEHPPFGSNLTLPITDYPRLCRTSGTSGEPISWPDTAAGWSGMLDAWEYIYRSAGITPGTDRIYFAFSFGPFLGFWTAYEAAARMGAMAIPGGGLGSVARLAAIADTKATVLCCTPTYALRLAEEKSTPLSIRTIIVAGEPGGSIPAVREKISAAWDGARVIDHHGMTEVGPVSFEVPDQPGNLCAIPGHHWVEILDRETGQGVEEGAEGELVLTTLRRADSPVIRYRTGDLVRKRFYQIDGEKQIGFEGGVLGRIDDMVVVRGVNVYPSAVDAVLRKFPEVAEYQVVETSERSMSEILLRIELAPSAAPEVVEAVAGQLRESLALRIPVELAEPGALPRYEFKSKRWVKS